MAEHSYFWPDVNGDREYTDDDLAEYSGGFATHGVFDGNLAVSAGTNMSIVIPSGRAYVGPAWKVRKYYNDNLLTLAIANADGVLNRKDTVVLRSDINERGTHAVVLTGTPASNPIAPAIIRTAEQYDLKIAEISIPAGTTAITQALITDTRLDSTVCGIVTGVFQQVDTTTFYNQIQADLASFKSVNEADFTAWVNSLKDVLDADTAGNLLNLINNHKTDYPSHVTQLTCTKSGTNYALTGLTATSGIVSCMFKSDAAFVTGDTFTVNGVSYTLQTANGGALEGYSFAAGAIVPVRLDISNKIIHIDNMLPTTGYFHYYTATKSGTVYTLTGDGALYVPIMIAFDGNGFNEGDTFSINGTSYAAQSWEGVALPSDTFAAWDSAIGIIYPGYIKFFRTINADTVDGKHIDNPVTTVPSTYVGLNHIALVVEA